MFPLKQNNPTKSKNNMIFSTIAQCLDAIFGAPTGMDVIVDHVEQYMNARRFILTLKFVG